MSNYTSSKSLFSTQWLFATHATPPHQAVQSFVRSHLRPPQFQAGQCPHRQHRIFMFGHIGVADWIPGTNIEPRIRVLHPFPMDHPGRAKQGRIAAVRTRYVGFVSYWVSSPILLSLSVPFNPALRSVPVCPEKTLTSEISGIWTEIPVSIGSLYLRQARTDPMPHGDSVAPPRRRPRRPDG